MEILDKIALTSASKSTRLQPPRGRIDVPVDEAADDLLQVDALHLHDAARHERVRHGAPVVDLVLPNLRLARGRGTAAPRFASRATGRSSPRPCHVCAKVTRSEARAKRRRRLYDTYRRMFNSRKQIKSALYTLQHVFKSPADDLSASQLSDHPIRIVRGAGVRDATLVHRHLKRMQRRGVRSDASSRRPPIPA